MTINRDAFRILGEFLIARYGTDPEPEGLTFDMDEFATTVDHDRYPLPYQIEVHACDTVACAAGHGPAAGLSPIDKTELWFDYVERVFGVTGVTGPSGGDVPYNWAFHPDWQYYDNTPVSAGHRCLYLAEHGAPPTSFNRVADIAFDEFKGFRV